MTAALLDALAAAILAAPLLAVLLLSTGRLLRAALFDERRIQRWTAWTFGVGTVAAAALWLRLATASGATQEVPLGTLLAVPGFHVALAIDLRPQTVTMLVLTFALCSLVAAYSERYLHRERGFLRFYLLLILFAFGMECIAVGANLSMVLIGWELVGLSSAMLIAFYHRRPGPARHGLRAWMTYRVTDVGLVAAVALLQHHAHGGDFATLGALGLAPGEATLVALLLVWGAMGKGAIAPLSGWLPKALEGPTPSSAIFYGALSIHASPYLLLRCAPLLDQAPAARVVIVALGAWTALHAATSALARPDIKTALGYRAVAHIGLMWVEVGCGWNDLALLHIVAHALARTWQLLRAPSALAHHSERTTASLWQRAAARAAALPWLRGARVARWQRAAWWWASEQWHLDAAGRALILAPLAAILRRLEAAMATTLTWLGASDDEAGKPRRERPR